MSTRNFAPTPRRLLCRMYAHIERLKLDDLPDLVVIQVYITSARRSYQIADHYRRQGVLVALGGLHVTSLADEAAKHADTILLGPGEDTWPRFIEDFRVGAAAVLEAILAGFGEQRPQASDAARRLQFTPGQIQ